MRGLGLVAIGLLSAAMVGHAGAARAAAPPAAGPAAGPTTEQVDALQQRLLASQQTIATLERQLADVKNRAVAMDQCRVKNGRLVFIGRELIEGYARRYRETQKDPLQLGRRRFEFELQSLSEAVYDNRADVPVPVPGERRNADSGAPSRSAPVPAPSSATAPGAAAPASTAPHLRSKDK